MCLCVCFLSFSLTWTGGLRSMQCTATRVNFALCSQTHSTGSSKALAPTPHCAWHQWEHRHLYLILFNLNVSYLTHHMLNMYLVFHWQKKMKIENKTCSSLFKTFTHKSTCFFHNIAAILKKLHTKKLITFFFFSFFGHFAFYLIDDNVKAISGVATEVVWHCIPSPQSLAFKGMTPSLKFKEKATELDTRSYKCLLLALVKLIHADPKLMLHVSLQTYVVHNFHFCVSLIDCQLKMCVLFVDFSGCDCCMCRTQWSKLQRCPTAQRSSSPAWYN